MYVLLEFQHHNDHVGQSMRKASSTQHTWMDMHILVFHQSRFEMHHLNVITILVLHAYSTHYWGKNIANVQNCLVSEYGSYLRSCRSISALWFLAYGCASIRSTHHLQEWTQLSTYWTVNSKWTLA